MSVVTEAALDSATASMWRKFDSQYNKTHVSNTKRPKPVTRTEVDRLTTSASISTQKKNISDRHNAAASTVTPASVQTKALAPPLPLKSGPHTHISRRYPSTAASSIASSASGSGTAYTFGHQTGPGSTVITMPSVTGANSLTKPGGSVLDSTTKPGLVRWHHSCKGTLLALEDDKDALKEIKRLQHLAEHYWPASVVPGKLVQALSSLQQAAEQRSAVIAARTATGTVSLIKRKPLPKQAGDGALLTNRRSASAGSAILPLMGIRRAASAAAIPAIFSAPGPRPTPPGSVADRFHSKLPHANVPRPSTSASLPINRSVGPVVDHTQWLVNCVTRLQYAETEAHLVTNKADLMKKMNKLYFPGSEAHTTAAGILEEWFRKRLADIQQTSRFTVRGTPSVASSTKPITTLSAREHEQQFNDFENHVHVSFAEAANAFAAGRTYQKLLHECGPHQIRRELVKDAYERTLRNLDEDDDNTSYVSDSERLASASDHPGKRRRDTSTRYPVMNARRRQEAGLPRNPTGFFRSANKMIQAWMPHQKPPPQPFRITTKMARSAQAQRLNKQRVLTTKPRGDYISKPSRRVHHNG